MVYISFGSMATLGEEQIEEITWGLKNSNFYFLWVVRESEVKKASQKFSARNNKEGISCELVPSTRSISSQAGMEPEFRVKGGSFGSNHGGFGLWLCYFALSLKFLFFVFYNNFGVFNTFKVMIKLFCLKFFKGLGCLFYVKLVDWA